MRKIPLFIKVAAVVWLVCFVSLSANPVNLYWIDVSPGVNIPLVADGTSYGSIPAGIYNVAIDFNGDGSYESFSGYCVDPAFVSSDPNPYSIIDIPDQENYLQAAYIFANYGTPGGSQAAADVQSAIWSVVGGFSFPDGLSQNAQEMANAAAAAVSSGWNAAGGLALAVSPHEGTHFSEGHQDFIIRTPEPGMAILLGLGLVGLFVGGRKRSLFEG